MQRVSSAGASSAIKGTRATPWEKIVSLSQLRTSLLGDPISQSGGGDGSCVKLEQIKTHLSSIRKESSPAGKRGAVLFQYARCQVNLQGATHFWLEDRAADAQGGAVADPRREPAARTGPWPLCLSGALSTLCP